MTTKMSKVERETFLAGVHVGILSLNEAGRGPLAAPVWYGYEPGGEIWFITERSSRKGKLLVKGNRISLCAQSEEMPYKYVTVEGPIAALEAADIERHLRPLARRYLGTEDGDRYVAATDSEREHNESVLVRLRPERWLTVDYGKVKLF
jgi:PPOX class probable F420-dependent enzyme